MKRFSALLISTLIFSTPFISSAKDLKDEIREIIKNNPSIIVDVINENPVIVIEALQNASKNAQKQMLAKREQEEKEQIASAINNPLKPDIRRNEAIRGTRNAPIVIVEYSDFECPYCAKGTKEVIQPLLKKYSGKIQFIYKHLPLSFHRQAKQAAQYYEAIRMQSEQLAFRFHDKLFENTSQIKNGEKFFISQAKEIGVNMSRLHQTLVNKIDAINDRIKEDVNEAAKFGIQGTPGFLVNGVLVKGAYPVEHFENIITLLQENNKLKI